MCNNCVTEADAAGEQLTGARRDDPSSNAVEDAVALSAAIEGERVLAEKRNNADKMAIRELEACMRADKKGAVKLAREKAKADLKIGTLTTRTEQLIATLAKKDALIKRYISKCNALELASRANDTRSMIWQGEADKQVALEAQLTDEGTQTSTPFNWEEQASDGNIGSRSSESDDLVGALCKEEVMIEQYTSKCDALKLSSHATGISPIGERKEEEYKTVLCPRTDTSPPLYPHEQVIDAYKMPTSATWVREGGSMAPGTVSPLSHQGPLPSSKAAELSFYDVRGMREKTILEYEFGTAEKELAVAKRSDWGTQALLTRFISKYETENAKAVQLQYDYDKLLDKIRSVSDA